MPAIMQEPIPLKGGAWSEEEDAILATMQKEVGNHWSTIAQHIPGRTGQQCAQRWRHKVNPNIRKDKWTEEEDNLLATLVEKFGCRWAEIARRCNGRTDQQCMGRWRRHLDPAISRAPWTEAEDTKLKRLADVHGSQWSRISKVIPGRTAQQCRARYFQIQVRLPPPGKDEDSDDSSPPPPQEPDPIDVKPPSAAARDRKQRSRSGEAGQAPASRARQGGTASATARAEFGSLPGGNSAVVPARASARKAVVTVPPALPRVCSPSGSSGSDRTHSPSLSPGQREPSLVRATPKAMVRAKEEVKPAIQHSPARSEEATSSVAGDASDSFVTPKKELLTPSSAIASLSPGIGFPGLPILSALSPEHLAAGGVLSSPMIGQWYSPLGQSMLPPSPMTTQWRFSPNVNFSPGTGCCFSSPSIFASACNTPASRAEHKANGKPQHGVFVSVTSASPREVPPWSPDVLRGMTAGACGKEKSCFHDSVKRKLHMTQVAEEVEAKDCGDVSGCKRLRSASGTASDFTQVGAAFPSYVDGCSTPAQLNQQLTHTGRPSLTPITEGSGSAFFGQDSRPSICSVNTDLDTKALAEAREAATQGFRSTLDPTGLNCYPAELAAHATLPLGDVNKENSHPSSPANTGSPLKVSRALPQPVPKRHLVHRSSDGVAHSRSRLNALLSLEDALA